MLQMPSEQKTITMQERILFLPFTQDWRNSGMFSPFDMPHFIIVLMEITLSSLAGSILRLKAWTVKIVHDQEYTLKVRKTDGKKTFGVHFEAAVADECLCLLFILQSRR